MLRASIADPGQPLDHLAEVKEAVMGAVRTLGLSTSLCQEALAALDRVFADVAPDEPDLGLNITYWQARKALLRLSRAKPWIVPAPGAGAIRETIAQAAGTIDPVELEEQLEALPRSVLHLLDRRDPALRHQPGVGPSRRSGDRSRLRVTSHSMAAHSSRHGRGFLVSAPGSGGH